MHKLTTVDKVSEITTFCGTTSPQLYNYPPVITNYQAIFNMLRSKMIEI